LWDAEGYRKNFRALLASSGKDISVVTPYSAANPGNESIRVSGDLI